MNDKNLQLTDGAQLAEFIREHRAKRGPEAGVCQG